MQKAHLTQCIQEKTDS